MLQYPSVPRWKDAPLGNPCIAFYKYDGSNLRFEWSPKRGWNKFGTRHTLFDKSDPLFGQALPIFLDEMGLGAIVEETIRYQFGRKVDRIVAFCEFFGASSFAGSHVLEEPKQLMLFDVSVYKQGFVPPRKFIKWFGKHDNVAKVVYDGNMNMQFIEDVRNRKYPVYEGVVCKGDGWAAKVKTIEYLERLKNERQGLTPEEYDE